MNTPVYDFVSRYISSDVSRLHMPGHKGVKRLGIEDRDITEIQGADVLYEASGILAHSEENAAALFGTGRTVYSTEGSSHVIKAMLYLALLRWRGSRQKAQRPVLLAARNAHKALLYAAALLDFDIEWLYPEQLDLRSICSCHPSPATVRQALDARPDRPFAVYLTSPDYLGFHADVRAISAVCAEFELPLLIDNAHGAYTHFLETPQHPMDLGAYLCADSAHKTLPCLTGGAYLHMSAEAAAELGGEANDALALFGSTSPSYLILQSLDLCNAYIAEGYPERLAERIGRLNQIKARLRERGARILETEPLKLTVDTAALGMTGSALAETLRQHRIEAEFADLQYLVLMFTPDNAERDLQRVEDCLSKAVMERTGKQSELPPLLLKPLQRVMPIREAIVSPHRRVPIECAVGKICGQPSVSCPPAIPIAVSGERLERAILPTFQAYGVTEISVVTES